MNKRLPEITRSDPDVNQTSTLKLKAFQAITKGKSHREKKIPCQDFVTTRICNGKRYGMVFVADGHGSDKHFRSKTGARVATKISKEVLEEFYEKHAHSFFLESKAEEINACLKQIERRIIFLWRKEIEKHFAACPIKDNEKAIYEKYKVEYGDNIHSIYGTTLIAALMAENFWFALQIGDGACMALDSDEVPSIVIPEDTRLGFGCTTSLCDFNAIDNFRECWGRDKIDALIVATDGMVDSFSPEGYQSFIKKFYTEFKKNNKRAQEALTKFLPTLSERGSRDDIAVAGVAAPPPAHEAQAKPRLP
jgi:serine/threonine protein phosphatase PrpC